MILCTVSRASEDGCAFRATGNVKNVLLDEIRLNDLERLLIQDGNVEARFLSTGQTLILREDFVFWFVETALRLFSISGNKIVLWR